MSCIAYAHVSTGIYQLQIAKFYFLKVHISTQNLFGTLPCLPIHCMTLMADI
jgi:hypothetical protein